MLVDGFFLYTFSLIITHIFYKIPLNHGLLIRIRPVGGSSDRLDVKYTTFKERNEFAPIPTNERNGSEVLAIGIKALNEQEHLPLANQRKLSKDFDGMVTALMPKDRAHTAVQEIGPKRRFDRALSMNRDPARSPS